MPEPTLRKLIPLLIVIPLVVLADQLTKLAAAAWLPYGEPVEVLGDFLRLTYVKNPVMAFSIGAGLPEPFRFILFLVLPLAVVGVLLAIYLFSREVTRVQRWLLAAIAGGGLGNALDRFFRSGGVVDFIDFRFYGILGFERWPTFNLADATVVVAGILLLITYLKGEVRVKK